MLKLYRKLAKNNLVNNGQFYLPYLITGILSSAMFYTMVCMQQNQGLAKLPGADSLRMILSMGVWVIGIFVCVFLFYTNSFIIKRRKREIGIYNVLGMEKKHIAGVLLLETCLIALCSIGGGLLFGIIFNKILIILLYRLIGFSSSIQFYISGKGIILTILLFGMVYLGTLFFNLMQVKLSNPIALLHGSSAGEKEPKTKLILTLIGFLSTGLGYYIAITTKNPIAALQLFFVAVILVIFGTYCLFTAGSIALLKLLRKNEKFYYQTSHFTAVSGMIYRMKQNAVGLANICILSTMVLVMLSTTVSMFVGMDDLLKTRFPSEITVTAKYAQSTDTGLINARIEEIIQDKKLSVEKTSSYQTLTLTTEHSAGRFTIQKEINDFNLKQNMLVFITKSDYESMTGRKTAELSGNDILIAGTKLYQYPSLKILNQNYHVKNAEKFIDPQDQYMADMIAGFYYVVLPDQAAMQTLYEEQQTTLLDKAVSYSYMASYDITGTKKEIADCDRAIIKGMSDLAAANSQFQSIYSEGRETEREGFLVVYGGLFFLGLFLGSMFLMVTVLIIFYKQISEGYEDRERFAIMVKVGMSRSEVKASIRSQILTVFFLPLLMAAVHVTAAFPMIKRLLALMNLSNGMLFLWCMIGTILVFTLIYLLVFIITSKSYYRIVRK